MSLRDDLSRVVARDARYSIHAYLFVLESLEYTKTWKRRKQAKTRVRSRSAAARHVSGGELCHGACDLALRQYGLLARYVLGQWGIDSTSDLGNIVYNMIASGDLEKHEADSRADFDNVFDFEEALSIDRSPPLEEIT